MLRGVVIARRAFSSNGGDRVLEHQMIDAIDLDEAHVTPFFPLPKLFSMGG